MTDPLASDMVAATLPVGPVEEDVDPAEEDIVPVERDVDPVEEDVGPMEKDVVPIEGSVPPAKEDAEKEGSDYDRPSVSDHPCTSWHVHVLNPPVADAEKEAPPSLLQLPEARSFVCKLHQAPT